MSEDKKIAAEMVERDMKQTVALMREQGVPVKVVSFENPNWPDGDFEGAFMPITIGVRSHLTKREARHCGAMWREVRRRYPKANLQINLLGFNDDPREIWDIPEAARYVRWWARFAGMDDPEVAERYALDAPSKRLAMLNGHTIAEANVGFLSACGVYGDEMKAFTLRNNKPVVAQ